MPPAQAGGMDTRKAKEIYKSQALQSIASAYALTSQNLGAMYIPPAFTSAAASAYLLSECLIVVDVDLE